MKIIELHILQSYPVSCLNRDDIGSPKTATFGGVQRARLSSQCLKRAIREHAENTFPEALFKGVRTCLIYDILKEKMQARGLDAATAEDRASTICGSLEGKSDKNEEKETRNARKSKKTTKLSTLMFLSPKELDELAERGVKGDLKDIGKYLKSVGIGDAADIAIFGRMVAHDSSLTLEGAALFSHALSTHQCDNEIDFFTAVDERKRLNNDAGAGMLGSLEFSSAVYYRYAGINLDLLFDKHHLHLVTPEQRRGVLAAFIRSTLMAVPNARKNSMNANTLPSFVLGIVKDTGQPIQLINAFEKPICPSSEGGILEQSIKQLLTHHEELKNTWGLASSCESRIPEKNLATFCMELLNHVKW